MCAAGNGGAIVNTSSWLAQRPMSGTSAYAASKGGLDAPMQAVARDVGPDQIRINSIYSGVIDTPKYPGLGGDDALARFAAITSLCCAALDNEPMSATLQSGCRATRRASYPGRV